MTFNELVAMVPEDKRDYEIDFNVMCGNFPSGEEGAEDWIMSSSLEKVDINDERRMIWLDITYA